MTQNQIKSLIDTTKVMIASSKKMRNGRIKSFSDEINNNIKTLIKVLSAKEIVSALGISGAVVSKLMRSQKKNNVSKKNGMFLQITPPVEQNHSLHKTSLPLGANVMIDTTTKNDDRRQRLPIMEFTTKSGTKIVIFE